MVRRNLIKVTNANIRLRIHAAIVRYTLKYDSIVWDWEAIINNAGEVYKSMDGARYMIQEWSK